MMIRLALIAAAAALALAACSGDGGNGNGQGGEGDSGGGGGGSSGRVEPCRLLTKAEIEAAVGNSVEDGRADFFSCSWDSEPDDISVHVNFLSLPNRQVCVDALKDDDVYEEAGGLSQPAFRSYNPVLGGLADVVVCTDRGQLQVTVNGGLDDTPDEQRLRAMATDLAQKALGRM